MSSLDRMRVYIPTLGRVGKQRTFESLPREWQKRTWYVIHKRERKDYLWHPRRVIVKKIGVCHFRQAALNHATRRGFSKMFMFDDDLGFNMRVDDWSPENPKLRAATPEDIGASLEMAEKRLDNFAAVGFGARFGNNRMPDADWHDVGRMMYAFGIDVEVFDEEEIRFDKFFFWEDFHVTLELLKRAYPNSIYLKCCVGSPTNAEGGVSLYRTPEKLRKVRDAFVRHHAPFVTPVDKTSKSWGGDIGDTVPDVRIAWRKAYSHGTGGAL